MHNKKITFQRKTIYDEFQLSNNKKNFFDNPLPCKKLKKSKKKKKPLLKVRQEPSTTPEVVKRKTISVC